MIDVGLVARYKCPRIIFHKSKCQIIVTRYSSLSYHQFYDRSLWVTMTTVSFYPAAFPSSPAVSRTRYTQHDVLARSHACTHACTHTHSGAAMRFISLVIVEIGTVLLTPWKKLAGHKAGLGPREHGDTAWRRHYLTPPRPQSMPEYSSRLPLLHQVPPATHRNALRDCGEISPTKSLKLSRITW